VLNKMEVVDVEDPIMHPYCGPKNLKPSSDTPHLKISTTGILFW